MFIRRRRAAVTLVSSLLLAGGLMAGGIAAAVPAAAAPAATTAAAVPAVAYPTVVIRLTNASQFCLNVTNNVNRSGQPLQLWTCSGSGDDHFYEIPDTGCFEGLCMQFQDVQNTSLCVSGPATVGGTVTLGACNSGRGTWYAACYAGHLGNGFLANSGNLSVSAPLRNGNRIYATSCTAPGGNTYQNWTGY